MKVPKLPSFLKRKNTSHQRAPEPSSPLLVEPHSPFNQAESHLNTTTQATDDRLTRTPKRSTSEANAASPTNSSLTGELRSTSTSSTSESYHELSDSFSSLPIPIEDNSNPFRSPRPNILDTTRHPVRSEGSKTRFMTAPSMEPAMAGRDRLRGMRLMVDEAKVKEGEAKRLLKQSRDAVKGLKKDLKKVTREEKIEKKKQTKADKMKAKGKGKP